MKLFPLGINLATGKLLFDPIDEDNASTLIQKSLTRNIREIRTVSHTLTDSVTFKGIEVKRKRTVDLGDPRMAGWTFLVNANDPKLSDYIEIIKPLAKLRGMKDPTRPLRFNNERPVKWINWYETKFHPLSTKATANTAPQYIMIVGGPSQIPFELQSYLDVHSSVGRLDFDSMEDLQAYVEKVVRLEEATAPVIGKDAIFFATDHGVRTNSGGWDPTHFSRLYMAEKLVGYAGDQNFSVDSLVGGKATKENLVKSLANSKPAVVYTASHGAANPTKDVEWQKRTNGAIICQEFDVNKPAQEQDEQDYLFTGEDIPQSDEPFLEGSIFFQFACFGYGTPQVTETSYWLGKAAGEEEGESKFGVESVSSLPKKLLAHPKGPIAYIGHLDAAVLHGFMQAEEDSVMRRWETRLEPFVNAIDNLLRVNPVGLAMDDMNERYSSCTSLLTKSFDMLERGEIDDRASFIRDLANTFVLMIDAKNYMVLGDPAARLRILDN